MTCNTARRLGFAAAAALALGSVATPAAAQIRALLPTIEEVEPLDALPIDGVWTIREINERIVITDGHAFAEDGWVHMMLFQIEPGQVVIQNIREDADGGFSAKDLPLMSDVKLEWLGQRTLRARTRGLIAATYHLDLVSADGPGFGGEQPGDDLPPLPPPPPSNDEEEYVSPW